MAYLIDGHNLIGQLADISLADPNDEAKLVLKLRGFAARKRKKCIVIFDKGIPAGSSGLSNTTVEVVFASPGSTADRIMIERIRHAKDPQQWIVVSGDSDVLTAAQMRGMRSMRSHEFVPMLNAPQPANKDMLIDKDGETPRAPHLKHKQRVKMDVHVPPSEVEKWLKIFGEGVPPDAQKSARKNRTNKHGKNG